MRAWLVALLAPGFAGCAASPAPDYAIVHHQGDAPAWAIPYGREPWLVRSSTEIAVDRVRHAIHDLRVDDPAFTARYGDRGLAIQPAGAAPLALATARIELGDRALDATGAWSILGNTAQRRWGPVVEHQAITADGAELAWVLRERMTGPLTVSLATDGLAYAGRTAGGDHFADGDGVARVRIGAAALVDARGQRWPIAAERDGTELRWRVPAEVLARAVFPVALDPLVGPELGSDRPITTTNGERGAPVLAWNGSEWLAVWLTTLGAALHATRISSTGDVLDPAGIVIDTGQDDVPALPRVASNGTDFFVAWDQATSDQSTNEIIGTKVSAAGALMGARLTIATDAVTSLFADGDSEGVGLATDGTDYIAAWATFNGVVKTHISIAGAVDVETPVAVGTVGRPVIAYNGTTELIAWNQNGGIFGAVVGSTTGTFQIMTAAQYAPPEAAASGPDFLVTAIDRASPSNALRGARVSGAGALLDATPFDLALDAVGSPDVAATAGSYLAIWATPSACEGVRVSSAGAILDAAPLALGAGSACAVAASDSAYLVARGGTAAGVFAGLVDTAGAVAPSARISPLAPNQQSAPAVATNTTGYLFVWSDDRAGGGIVGTRVTPAGEIEDLDGIAIATAPGLSPASLGSNGTDYLVTWTAQAQDAVYGARVTAGGAVDPAPIAIARSIAPGVVSHPVVGGLNGAFLVAWSDTRSGQPGVYATPVSAGGVAAAPTGTAIAIGGDAADVAIPDGIATNGTEYMLAWERPSDGVHATALTPAGARKGADLSFEPGSSDASIASDGSDFFLAWRGANSVDGARVSAGGVNLDPAPIPLAPPGTARIASDAYEYVLIWGNGELVGDRVLSNGTVFDQGSFLIAEQSGAASATGFDGLPTLVAYESHGRVTARLISQRCGDAMLDPDEGCDDGNAADHDGCNALCQVESGFTCFGSPSSCMPTNAGSCGQTVCDPEAVCTNVGTGPMCVCQGAFVGDGQTCTFVDDIGRGGGCGCTTKRDGRSALACVIAVLLGLRRRRRPSRPARPARPCPPRR